MIRREETAQLAHLLFVSAETARLIAQEGSATATQKLIETAVQLEKLAADLQQLNESSAQSG